MIFIDNPQEIEKPESLPSKEVFLEDIDKTLSYPSTMHDDDIALHVGITEYKKSPAQAIRDALGYSEESSALSEIGKVLSDKSMWEKQGKKIEETMKAIPKFLSAMGNIQDPRMIPATPEQFLQQNEYRIAAAESAAPILESIFENVFARTGEMRRTFIKDIVNDTPEEKRAANLIKAFIEPESVEKIASPENKPFTEAERSGGILALLPRAIQIGLEDFVAYGPGKLRDIPKLLDAFELNAARSIVKENIMKFTKTVMENSNMTAMEAASFLKQKPVLEFIKTSLKDESGKTVQFFSGAGPADLSGGVEGAAKKLGEKAKEIKAGFKERSFVTSVKEEMPNLKVAGQYIPRSTDELAIKARTQIQDNLAVAEQMAKTGTDDASIATGSELLKHYCEEAAKATSPAVKNAMLDKAAELANGMAVRLTELGRSVQAASILARLTPEGQLRFAARTIQKYNDQVAKDSGLFGLKKKIPELTPTQADDILKKMKDITLMPEGEAKAIAFKDLQGQIADLVPTPLFKKIITIWKAGLLTGIKTSGLNTLSNFSHAFGTEVLKDLPASAVDSVAALFTGKRSVAFTVRGMGTGTKEGFNKGWRFLKTGYDERNVLGKLEHERISFGKGKVAKALQTYEESVFRILGAEDQVFYYGAKARSIAEQAKVQAINKGLKGAAKKKFIDDLITNPTDDMAVFAVGDAETAVFQNNTALSKAASGMKRAAPITEIVLPFSKTPSAVAMQILNYSPVGIAKTILSNIGKGKFNQRMFSQGMGRGLTGTAILGIGATLGAKGLIALDKPNTESDQKLWDLEGRKPNSIKVGDKWRSIQVLGPAGNLLLIGAQFDNAFKKSGSPTEAIAIALGGSAKAFTEQTFLKGVQTATEAISDPMRYAENYAGQLVSSAIPTIVGDVARATDTKERRTESIAQRVAAKIPILREGLEPQIDVFGRERMIKENFFETMADPTRPMTENQDPVVQEIKRIKDAGASISTTQIGDKEGYDILTQRQNTELWERAGSLAYDKIITYMDMGNYENLDDIEKARDINKIITQSKNTARAEKVLEITEGLDGYDLFQKLAEAKKKKLLSADVLDLYKRMR
jgi:hypothetical protein